jgi:hypothetical protein
VNSEAIDLFCRQRARASVGVHDIDGERVAFVTDGCILITARLADGEPAPASPASDPLTVLTEKQLRHGLNLGSDAAPRVVDGARLVALVGAPDWNRAEFVPDDPACEECDGAGFILCECQTCNDPHERDCPSCDGKSNDPPSHNVRFGRIGAATFDLNLLAQGLATVGPFDGLPLAPIEVRLADLGGAKLIRIDADHARVTLMAMRGEFADVPETALAGEQVAT